MLCYESPHQAFPKWLAQRQVVVWPVTAPVIEQVKSENSIFLRQPDIENLQVRNFLAESRKDQDVFLPSLFYLVVQFSAPVEELMLVFHLITGGIYQENKDKTLKMSVF